MSEYLLMTDTHLSESTIEVNRTIWQQAIKVCLEKGIEDIFHLGDFFDSRKAQTQELLMVMDELLTMVSTAGLRLTGIAGNHDKTDYHSADSFLHAYRYHPDIDIVDSLVYIKGEYIDIMLLPFFDEKSGLYMERLKGASEFMRKGVKNILLTHVGIDDAVMNSGVAIEDHVAKEAFKAFDKVIIGHYHDYQELNDGQIVYMGSAYQANYGENDKKGFQILSSDGTLEFIQAKFPKYIKVVLDAEEVTKEDLSEVKKKYVDSKDNVRFEFKGSREKLSKIDKGEFISLGIDVKMKEESVEVNDYSKEDVSSFTQESIKEEWKDFTKDDEVIQEMGLTYID